MITQFNRDDLVKNLPDAYAKTPDSNIAKILAIVKTEIDKLRENNRLLYESLDIDKASGYALDLYGEMVGQERGKATDAQYRMLIKSRIIRNLTNGDYNSIVTLLALIFDCSPTDFVLAEEAAGIVRFEKLPFEALNRSAVDTATALKIINEIMPAGVRMESVEFEGTFEFSDGTALVYDAAAGFGDVEQTLGGYFGFVFSGDEVTDLPV